VSTPDEVAAQAARLRRKMSWGQLALSLVAGIVMVVALNALAEGLGVEPRDAELRSVATPVVIAGSLAVYTLAAAVVAWLLARGDPAVVPRRLAFVFLGGLLLIALSAAVNALQHPGGGAGGGSGRGGGGSTARRRSSRGGGRPGLAAAVCDPGLAAAVLGGGALDGPRSLDSALMRHTSSSKCWGPAGTVLLSVRPVEHAGGAASTASSARLRSAVARDERWLVRAVAHASGGQTVDDAALQAFADGALARLDGVTGA
jgi:hypothetical protein